MAIDTLFLTRNDLQPYYLVGVTNSTGAIVDLTGATVRVTMRLENSTALTIDRSTAGLTVTGATSGEFQYQWQAGDTNSPGTFDIEFEITPASGGKFTLPNPSEGVAHVRIFDSLDST